MIFALMMKMLLGSASRRFVARSIVEFRGSGGFVHGLLSSFIASDMTSRLSSGSLVPAGRIGILISWAVKQFFVFFTSVDVPNVEDTAVLIPSMKTFVRMGRALLTRTWKKATGVPS